MQQRKKRKSKCIYSILAGMLAAILLSGSAASTKNTTSFPETTIENNMLTAWWGTLYPEFCFSKTEPEREIRFALWVALSSLW